MKRSRSNVVKLRPKVTPGRTDGGSADILILPAQTGQGRRFVERMRRNPAAFAQYLEKNFQPHQHMRVCDLLGLPVPVAFLPSAHFPSCGTDRHAGMADGQHLTPPKQK